MHSKLGCGAVPGSRVDVYDGCVVTCRHADEPEEDEQRSDRLE